MCDRLTTLETHLKILGTLSPFAAINFIRKGMGYEEYLREYAQYRKIKPEELLETLDRFMRAPGAFKNSCAVGNLHRRIYQAADGTGTKAERPQRRCDCVYASCSEGAGI